VHLDLVSDYYLHSLLLTLAIELGIVASISRLNRRALLIGVIVNLITHPWASYVYAVWNVNFFVVEVLVIVVEAILWRTLWPTSRSMAWRMSLLANASSALIGTLLL
jgi:hypothetical protein